MGGIVIETESEKLIRKGREAGEIKGRVEGRAEQIIEMGREFGLDDASILKRMQDIMYPIRSTRQAKGIA